MALCLVVDKMSSSRMKSPKKNSEKESIIVKRGVYMVAEKIKVNVKTNGFKRTRFIIPSISTELESCSNQ